MCRSAGPSGGTAYSILSTIESMSFSDLLKSSDSQCLIASPQPPTRAVPRKSLLELVSGARQVPYLGALTTCPTTVADESIVNRSSTLMPAHYGPKFSFRQYLRVRSLFMATVFHYAFTIGIGLLVFAPFRWLARRVWPAPGAGPTKEETKNDISEWRVVVPTNQQGSTGEPKKVMGSIFYLGGHYELTAVAVSCAAKVILEHEDEVKSVSAGLVTPATLGQWYVDELEKNGFKFQVKVLDE